MEDGRKVRLIFVLGIWNLAVCVILYFSRPERLQTPEHLQKRGGVPRGVHWKNPIRAEDPAKERINIFFLKTHKCGSSTVQNILMRFGYARHLDFVLPSKGNYLGYPKGLFETGCVAKEVMSPKQTFNIFAHHTRFNFEEIKSVMKEDAAFVTIFREPSYVFEAVYHYYARDRAMNMSLKQLIRSPKDWSRVRQNCVQQLYGTNQMSWDLGFEAVKFDGKTGNTTRNNTRTVREFVLKIEREFDLVMIMEHIEASLVLLCDLMNWPLEHVMHLQLNKRRPKRVPELDPGERYMLLKMNPIDDQVYEYFIHKFRGLVRDYGVEKMKSQVEKLLNLNSDLDRTCMLSANYGGHMRTVIYDARNTQDTLCYYATMNELEFTRKIREDQFRRFKVLRELDALMEEF